MGAESTVPGSWTWRRRSRLRSRAAMPVRLGPTLERWASKPNRVQSRAVLRAALAAAVGAGLEPSEEADPPPPEPHPTVAASTSRARAELRRTPLSLAGALPLRSRAPYKER